MHSFAQRGCISCNFSSEKLVDLVIALLVVAGKPMKKEESVRFVRFEKNAYVSARPSPDRLQAGLKEGKREEEKNEKV